ncbi:MAG: MscL family protein [Bacilli bacterium]|nr:MscL family protein [Bacilli bacterium]
MTEEEKLAKKKAKAERKAKGEGLVAEFKKFVTRGNVLDMSIGVIMGGAFNAIVTALTNILLSVATWAVPGGLKGLVTVLPAVNDAQRGAGFLVNGVTQHFQSFTTAEVNQRVIEFAANQGVEGLTTESATFLQWKTSMLSLYTLHGTTYTYNMSAVIDWGTFINAIISFLIIALTLFIILKTFTSLKAKRKAFEEQLAAKLNKGDAEEEKPAEETPAA